MRDAVLNAVTVVATFVPLLVGFLLILVIGLLIAKALSKAVDKLLTRVGFDRAVERGGIKKVLSGSKLDASEIVSKIVYYALVLFVLQLAFGIFGPNPISDLLTRIIAFLPSLVVAIVIVVVAAAIAAAVKTLLQNTLGGLSYGPVLANIASVFLLFLGIFAALNQVGVATTVTTPVLVAVLATIGGILIVGVGGGLVKPMQERWDGWLSRAEAEAPRIRQEAQNAPSVAEQARQAAAQVQQRVGGGSGSGDGRGGASVYGQPTGAEVPFDQDAPATRQHPGPAGTDPSSYGR